MRILQISSAKNFGGGEKHLVDLCKGLTGKNHDVSTAVCPNAAWLERFSFLPPEKIFYLPLRNSLDILSVRKLAKIIRDRRIEIVHAHLARDYPIAAIAARMTKTKLVLTRHLLFSMSFLHKFLLPKNTALIAVSEGVRQKILVQKILSPEQVFLIYNGIDTKHFASARETADKEDLRKKLNLSSDCKIVGIAGEITAHKGQADFVRAAFDILKHFPKTEFLIIGQDSSPRKENQKQLEELIRNFGLQNKIHSVGFRGDVAPFYSILDVFVSASHTEPFGLVIAEAMANGCAVVATATDGAKEIIINETGKIVPIKNPAAIAEAVSEFLSDEKLSAEFGKRAQIYVGEMFSRKRMITETEDVYKKVLDAKFD